jgi:hypothetical protein
MSTIQLIADPREPSTIQLYATNCDASVAAIAGSIQMAVWLPVEVARKLFVDLGLKFGEEIKREGSA